MPQIRDHIRRIAPEGFHVNGGQIRGPSGRKSEHFDFIIHQDQESAGTHGTSLDQVVSLRKAVAILEIAPKCTDKTLSAALARIAQVKEHVRATFDPSVYSKIPKHKLRNFIPEHRLPYALLAFESVPGWDRPTPSQVLCLHGQLKSISTALLPDEILLPHHQVAYKNPLLARARTTEHDIGWSRLPPRARPVRCYICQGKVYRRHFHYDFLCVPCGDINYLKRVETADLTGRIALLSGARIRIGFEAALRLLRAGAKVIALTRFPHDAARRYSQAADYPQWARNLAVCGVDFRDLAGVQAFIDFTMQKYPHLDILVNNAAQTVRHPPAYYADLLPFEREAHGQLPKYLQPLLADNAEFQEGLRALPQGSPPQGVTPPAPLHPGHSEVLSSAELSQVPLIEGDDVAGETLFPAGRVDQHGEPVDLRSYNSWVARVDELSLPEMLEVQLINQVAPTLLVSKLKPMLERSPHRDKYIVNVSSPEGQFSLPKEGRHPHTCMAKAALNMLTHSIASDYAQAGIYVNSVDPGWVSEQFPFIGARERTFAIDMVDAAARVLDPVYLGVNRGKYWRGRFFKHYQRSDW